jgi:hypothetical protein
MFKVRTNRRRIGTDSIVAPADSTVTFGDVQSAGHRGEFAFAAS